MARVSRRHLIILILRWTVLTLGLLFGAIFGYRALCPPVSDAFSPQELAAAQAALTPRTKPIEQVRLGERTAGKNPLRKEVDEGTEPTPETWRQVNLVMTKPSGKELQIELLRPLDWLEAIEAEPGSTIDLDLPEMGATGPAEVLSIAPCPTIQPGDGNVVTGRFTHEPDGELVNVHRACLDDRLESKSAVHDRTTPWTQQRNKQQIGVDWQFTTADTRIKLKRVYPKIRT